MFNPAVTSVGSRWSLLGGWLLLKEHAKLSKICGTASSFVDATGYKFKQEENALIGLQSYLQNSVLVGICLFGKFVSERNISIFLKSIISNSFPLNYFGDTIPTTTTMGNEFPRSVFCISFKQKQGTLNKSIKKVYITLQ